MRSTSLLKPRRRVVRRGRARENWRSKSNEGATQAMLVIVNGCSSRGSCFVVGHVRSNSNECWVTTRKTIGVFLFIFNHCTGHLAYTCSASSGLIGVFSHADLRVLFMFCRLSSCIFFLSHTSMPLQHAFSRFPVALV